MTTRSVLRDTLAARPDMPAGQSARVRRTPLWKRAMDVTVATTGLLLLSPLLVLIALAIRLDSAGAPLYRQSRVGRGGRIFACWKFRTMHVGAEEQREALVHQNQANGAIFKMRDDPRVTRVGRVLRKTSLDELPQLWNVLRGDMSLVGPRPLPLADIEGMEERNAPRLVVAPGITGLWQVRARHRHDFDEMATLDVEYAERLSLRLDLTILLLTVPTVLLGRGSC